MHNPKETNVSVTLYTRPGCSQCVSTKRILDDLRVSYETVDISQDEDAYAYVMGLGCKSLPVVTYTDTSDVSVDDYLGPNFWSGAKSVAQIKELLGV